MKRTVYIITAALLALLAMPKAIGLTLLYYVDNIPLSQFGDGPPSDLKALHEATEKAFKAMQENIAKVQDTASKALEEVRQEGTLHAKTNETLTELGTAGKKMSDDLAELKARTLDTEQKLAAKAKGDERPKSAGAMVIDSDQFKGIQGKNALKMDAVNVGSFHKVAILTGTINNDQPLVAPDRLAGIISPALRRLTIRDLLPQTRTTSNLIEFARELVFTNNAGPQYDASPGSTDGAIKPESGITFELASVPVITYAHFVPASRQILADAPMLQGYVDGRLRYGLALAEENALLTGDGTAGTLNGLNNNATAFTGGATNQTALDTLLKAQLQVSLSYYEVTGYVLHPTDWVNILLLKDTQGRYLFSDPHGMEQPRVWGKDVVATAAQTTGQFLAGNFSLAGEIFDREDATVRVAEQHADFFVRNMVAILAEERLALAIYRPAAFVKGAISNAG